MAAVRLSRFAVPGQFFPSFGIFRLTCRINRYFTTSSFRSSANYIGEKGLNEVVSDFSEHDRHKLRKEDFNHQGCAKTSVHRHDIPSSEDLNLYEYVKKLERTYARGKGNIFKSWSSLLTKHLKNSKLNVSAGLKPESPRILGLTANLLEERLIFLAQIGITGRDALIIALEFPAILSWDSASFTEMLKVLNDLNCDIVKLMCRTPYVFGLEHSRAIENIHKLETAGLPKDTIGKLVSENPLILSFPFRDDSLEIIALLMESHNDAQSNGIDEKEDEKAVLSLLLQSLEKFKEQVSSRDNFKQVVGFLHEMQVSPLIIAAKNPMFFNIDINTLISAVEFFRSKPLLLEMEVIQHLLIARTEFFVKFDIKAMTNRVQLIYDIVQSPTVLYNLAQTRFLFDNDNAAIEDVIHWFQSKCVDDKEIANLVTSKNFFSLDKRELTERLEYLLSVNGVNMEDVRKNPACLLKPLAHLKARVEFLKAKKPDVLNESNLCRIMTYRDEHFATEICASTLFQFTQFAQSLIKHEV
ncbi:uncharacterized protein LOC144654386 [Oculina patagonica]